MVRPVRLRLLITAAVAVSARRTLGARRGRPRSRDRGAPGVAALEGDVLRHDRRPRRPDDGQGPAARSSARPGFRSPASSAPRTRAAARCARPAARRAPRARARVRTAGTSRRCSSCSRAPAICACSTSTATSARRRRRRSSASSAPAASAVDGVAGPATLTAFGHGRRAPVLTQATATAIAGLVRRAPRRHADRDRREAQDDRARAGQGERPRSR